MTPPNFPKNRMEMRGILFLVKGVRLMRPLLTRLGMNLDPKLLDDTIKIAENLLFLAERFNPVFASRGWIACNAINTEAAREALAAAAEQRWEDADNILAEAYSPIMVRINLSQLRDLRCVRNRMPLALLALEDYEAGRFHACVPVTLALLDGMGQELTGANFFRNTRKIRTKESFIEIGPGVSDLLKTLSRPRQTTTTDSISIPYRHGILHGTDLGYNNRVVAAKAWAALLAVGHYAADELAPPPTPQPGLLETLRKSAETRKRLDAMEADMRRWEPRSSDEIAAAVAGKVVETGPEATAMRVFDAWQARKFGVIAHACTDALKHDVNALAGRVRKVLGPPPKEVHLLSIIDEAPAASTVTVSATWDNGNEEISVRLLYHKEEYIAPRTSADGRWLLASLWPLESAGAFATDAADDDRP